MRDGGKMTEPLLISENVREKIRGLIIITGVLEVGSPNIGLISDYLNRCWRKLTETVRQHGYKTHPLIAQWREALRNAGVPLKRCPPSIEAIAKRTTKSDSPFSINPIVDVYNAISMDLVLPLGAYDVDQLDGGLSLRVCNAPEPFIPLGGSEPEQTEVDEIVYADRSDILTRHFLWRQAEKGKITSNSRKFMFLCELLDAMGAQMLMTARSLVEEKFPSLLGGTLSEVTVLK
jgi:DNA/RNA-binding domain of Phe-tRNA-synthetase-like protein